MKEKIGLITYHAAYNFGSALQAYGTVKTLEKLGCEVETIDYQTKASKLWYHVDYSLKKGWRSLIYNRGFLKIKKEREIRAKKFDDFVKSNLHLTPQSYETYEEIQKANLNYPILISGSDQVWNRHCGEFAGEPETSIYPYFLKFGNPRLRIAYASSFGVMLYREIVKSSINLKEYNSLSTREPIICEWLKKATGKDVSLVCDPTWLLDKHQWSQIPGLGMKEPKRPYIFVYILYMGAKEVATWLQAAKRLAKANGWDVICICPLNYVEDESVTIMQDAGPLDFLQLMMNAQFVITKSFHGTIFSMNFEVPFVTIRATPDSRHGQMLRMCGLEDRAVVSPDEIVQSDLNLDFTTSRKVIGDFRKSSIEYLRKALQQ